MYLKFGSAPRLGRTSVMKTNSRGVRTRARNLKKRSCDGVVRCDVVSCVWCVPKVWFSIQGLEADCIGETRSEDWGRAPDSNLEVLGG